MNAVGIHILKLRKQHNLSQEALAEKLNVTRQAVSQWENGNTQPNLDTLERIADMFGVDIHEVIYGERRRNAPHLTPRQRKRHWIGVAVFSLIALAMVILSLLMEPYLSEQADRYYNMVPSALYYSFAYPLLYISIAFAILNGCSLIGDIRIKCQWVRRLLLTVSVACALMFYGSVMGCFVYLEGAVSWFVFDTATFFLVNHAIFLLPGIGLFIGLTGHREKVLKLNS